MEWPLRSLDDDTGMTVLACVCALDLATQQMGHELKAVTDAEHGYAQPQETRVERRRALAVDASRPTGKEDGPWLQRAQGVEGKAVRMNLAVHALLADTTRDELRVL
jgi:hypothetical protein